MKKRISKLVVFVMILTLIISSISTAFAEPVTLEMRTLSSYYKNHHNVIGWGAFDSNITVFKIKGEYAFCTQAGNGIRDGAGNAWDGSSSFNSDYTISQVTEDNSTQSKIAYLGFLQYKDTPSIWNNQETRDWYYAMTQMMIWQTLPATNITANGMTNGQYNSYFLNSSMASEYAAFKQRIQAKLDSWSTRPSFNATTVNIKAGETVTLTDANSVLSDYNSFSYTKNGITVNHTKGSNTLTIMANKECSQKIVRMTLSELIEVGAYKYSTDTEVNYIYEASNSQNLAVYGSTGDPVGLALSFNVDTITGKIAIEKTKAPDASSDKAVPEQGAVFQVYLKSAGSYSNAPAGNRDIITTGADGKAMTKDLPHGTYTVHQTKGAEGHVLTSDFDVTIGTDQHDKIYTYSIENDTLKSKIQIVKKDSETGKVVPRAGVAYEITNVETGKQVIGPGEKGYFTTDEKGYITIDKLYYGRYLLTERKAPEGYVLGDPVEFTVDGSQETITVEQYDKTQKGLIKIEKRGEILRSVSKNENGTYTPVYAESGLQGAEFEVKAAENITAPDGSVKATKGQVITNATTDSGGNAKVSVPYIGKYEVKETKAPEGYVLDDTIYPVEIKYAGQEVEVSEKSLSVSDERQKAKISLEKLIEEDELFSINAEDIYKDIKFGLFAGEEITAKDGSVIPKDGLIETIGLSGGNGQYTAAFSTDVPNSKYYVKEMKTAQGYMISEGTYPVDFSYATSKTAIVNIKVNDGKPIENKIIRGNISGHKTTDDGNDLAGALIGLFREGEKDFSEKNAIMTTRSEEDGSFAFTSVPYGRYIVKEITAPKGCILNEKEFKIEVKGNGQVIEIDMKNELQMGKIMIHKTGDILYTIEKKGEEYTPKFKEGGIEGAVFEVKAAEDIVTPDGIVRAKKGEVVDTITTDKEGNAKTKNLYIGKYTVSEVTAPYGHVIDTNVYETELKYQGQDKDATGYELNLENTRQRAQISLNKFIEEDELFGIYAKDIYEDISFSIFADEEIVAADGSVIPKDGLIETIGIEEAEESEAEGGKLYFGQFTKELPNGMYYVKETKTNEQYVIDDNKYPIDFSYSDQTVKTAYIAANSGEDLGNHIIRGKISIFKTEANGAPVSGVIFGLFKLDEKDFDMESALFTSETNQEGLAEFKDISYGEYILKELKAPKGYLLTEDMNVEVSEDEQIIEITAVDDVTKIEILKVDEKGNPLAGAVLQLIDKNGHILYEWETTEEPYYIEKLTAGEKYTLHEVSAPEGYSLSADIDFTVEDTPDVQKIEFKNALAPKTGDDINMFAWLSLLIAALTVMCMIAVCKGTKATDEVDGDVNADDWV